MYKIVQPNWIISKSKNRGKISIKILEFKCIYNSMSRINYPRLLLLSKYMDIQRRVVAEKNALKLPIEYFEPVVYT